MPWAKESQAFSLKIEQPGMTIENRWPSVPGETPIDDISGLLVKGVTARRELNHLEAENIANIWLRLKGERSTEWPEPELGDASSIRIE